MCGTKRSKTKKPQLGIHHHLALGEFPFLFPFLYDSYKIFIHSCEVDAVAVAVSLSFRFRSVPSRIQFCCVVTSVASHFHLTFFYHTHTYTLTHTPSFSFALLWVQVQCFAALSCFSDCYCWFCLFVFFLLQILGFLVPPLMFGLLRVVGLALIFFFFFVFFIDFDWLLLSFLKVNSWGVCLGLIWLIWGNENVLFVSTLKCDVWCLFSDDCVMCSVWGFWRVAPENGWHSRSGWGCRGKV